MKKILVSKFSKFVILVILSNKPEKRQYWVVWYGVLLGKAKIGKYCMLRLMYVDIKTRKDKFNW